MRVDPTGEFGLLAALAVGAVVGVVSQFVGGVIGNAMEGKRGADLFAGTGSVADYATAAVSGMVAATGIGQLGAVAVNTFLSMTAYCINCGTGDDTFSEAGLIWSIGAGAVSGFIGGRGADVCAKGAILDIAEGVIQNSSSAKKIALYTAKKIAVKIDLAESLVRTVASIVVPNVAKKGTEVFCQ